MNIEFLREAAGRADASTFDVEIQIKTYGFVVVGRRVAAGRPLQITRAIPFHQAAVARANLLWNLIGEVEILIAGAAA
jgi:hypothetical protein